MLFSMLFRDSITPLPVDPKELEEYLKRLPPEVIKQFAANFRKQGESEMQNNLIQILSRLQHRSVEEQGSVD